MKKCISVVALVLLGACSSPSLQGIFATADDAAVAAAVAAANEAPIAQPVQTLDPTPAPPPPANARTVDQFDTTTVEDRAAAIAAPADAIGGERALGLTIASLGAPTDPGIWLKTPLVSTLSAGRLVYEASGKSVNVELRPSGGAPGSGSQISLAAMRLLEVPLTSLPELQVFAQ